MKKVGYIGFFILLLGSSILFAGGKEESSLDFEDLKPQIIIPIGHWQCVWLVAFSPEGRYLASGGGDNTIKVWQVASGKLLRTLKGHSGYVSSVAFSPDGRHLASGSWDNTIKVWQVASGELLRTLKGHSGWVHSVAFSPDGRYLASGSFDATVKMWDVESGKSLATFLAIDKEDYISYTDDGYFDASPGASQYVKFRAGNEVYDLEQYETVYRRPDIIARVLGQEMELREEDATRLMKKEEISPPMKERSLQDHMQSLFTEMLLKIKNRQRGVIAVSGFTARGGKRFKLIDLLNETLLSELGKVDNLTVVERSKLHKALEEQGFSVSDLMDTSKAISVGKLLAAQYMLTGLVTEMSGSVMIFGRIINVETAQVESAAQIIVPKSKNVEALLQSK